MRDLFPEYYRPTDHEFRSLWSSATVVLDASVLLDLYEYSETTIAETFTVLQKLADSNRLWLPHQAALEYQRGRPAAIVSQETEQYDIAYAALPKLRKIADELREKLGQHAYLDPDDTVEIVEKAARDYEDHLKRSKEGHPSLRDRDNIRSRLDALYASRIGQPWSPERSGDVAKDGKERYEREIPPGFADKDKPAHLRYGDLVFWFQVLEFATASSASIIVVTNDAKEDWWTKPKGQLFGPRPELRAEFRAEVGGDFYMYSHDRFMKWAADYLRVGVDQESIDEIRDVRESRAAIGNLDALFGRQYPVFTLPDMSKAISPAMFPKLPNLTATLNLPDFSKIIGQIKFPDYPDLTAILNIPDYSKIFGSLNLPGGNSAPTADIEDGELEDAGDAAAHSVDDDRSPEPESTDDGAGGHEDDDSAPAE